MRRSCVAGVGLLLSVTLSVTTRVRGQDTAYGLQIDPSVRATGMGGASMAVFWGEGLDTWLNPSLNGYQHGVLFAHGSTQFIPDRPNEAYSRTDEFSLGAWGIGLLFAGKPIEEIGGWELEYGSTEASASNQGSPGEYRAHEDVSAFGIGLNCLEAIDSAARVLGASPPNLSRWGDISLGLTNKSDEVHLGPHYPRAGSDAIEGEVSDQDRGLAVRLTPYNSFEAQHSLVCIDRFLDPITSGVRIDGAYGESIQNLQENPLVLIDDESADHLTRHDRHGLSARVAVGLPGPIVRSFEKKGHAWLVAALTPLVSFGYASDRDHFEYEAFFDTTGANYSVATGSNEGWELTIANIYTIRRGHGGGESGQVFGDSEGWGLGFRIGDLASFRYDKAELLFFPEPERPDRQSWQLTLDPIVLWHVLHGGSIVDRNRHF